MRTLWFQPLGGASGDMVLGALVGLGVDVRRLEAAVAGLDLGPFAIRVEEAASHGVRGVRVHVDVGPRGSGDAPAHGHGRAHGHAHGHGPAHAHADHEHRSYRDIRAKIEGSALPAAVKADSVDVFRRLAEAEGRVHGVEPDAVRFHEVGAVDSIVDIVGACWARHELGVGSACVDPFPAGRGTVTCRHGVYPVPAPATVELLKGFPVVDTGEEGELVTPTGAALLTAWHRAGAREGAAVVRGVGLGFGHRALAGRPNLLRAVLLESAGEGTEGGGDLCLVLETNLDDTTPELVGVAVQRLLEAGALDAFVVPVQMKKQRPGALVTVLCRPDARERMLEVLFAETTTFGVRERWATRTTLDRRIETVETPYGSVRVKVGSWRGRDVTRAPEMDDCIARARERGVAVRAVYEAAARPPRA